jgi:hypothetical protein
MYSTTGLFIIEILLTPIGYASFSFGNLLHCAVRKGQRAQARRTAQTFLSARVRGIDTPRIEKHGYSSQTRHYEPKISFRIYNVAMHYVAIFLRKY